MTWLFQAAKTGRIKSLAQAIREFFKMNGRMPSTKERNTMGNIIEQVTGKSNVVQFPKVRITDWWKTRPGKGKKDVEEVFFDHPDDPRLYKPTKKPPKGKINYPAIEKKFGFPLRGNESLSELAKIEKMGRDQYYNSLADRAMSIRTRMS